MSPSLLFHPEWWWVAALVLAVGTAIAAYRKGLRAWGLAAVGMILGVVVLTAFLMWVSGSTWDDFLYYPSKAMWTGLVVVIPLAAAGGTVLLLSFWRRASRASSTVRLAMRGIAVCVVALIMAMVVGRGQAFPPHLVGIAQGAASGPNWSLAIMESLGKFDIPAQSRSGALIMGVEPSANPIGIHLGSTGTTDYLGMEALSQAGFAEAMTSPVKRDLAVRDSQRLCQYLKDHPDSLRFTGPNPAAGPGWMLDAGCPEQVVEPERWISLQFAPEWLERSPWADPDTWVYPTVAEVEAEGGKNLRVDASLLD